ncbi:hypothetical protein [Agromyces sp. NPDC055658]
MRRQRTATGDMVDASARARGIRLLLVVTVTGGGRDEGDQPCEDERERDDLEHRQVEPPQQVVARHRRNLDDERDVREADEPARHALRVPAGAEAERRERRRGEEGERVVQHGHPVDRHGADAHEPEADEADVHPHRGAGATTDAEPSDRECAGQRSGEARHAGARHDDRDVEAQRGEVVRRAQGREVAGPPVARGRDAHAREAARGEQHGDEVEGAICLVVERVPVQSVGADAEDATEQQPVQSVPARQGVERGRREVHGEQGERRPGESVRDRPRTRAEARQPQVCDRRQARARRRGDEQRSAHGGAARDRGHETRRVERSMAEDPAVERRVVHECAIQHDRDGSRDEQCVDASHDRREAGLRHREGRGGVAGGGQRDRPAVLITVGIARVARSERSRERPAV